MVEGGKVTYPERRHGDESVVPTVLAQACAFKELYSYGQRLLDGLIHRVSEILMVIDGDMYCNVRSHAAFWGVGYHPAVRYSRTAHVEGTARIGKGSGHSQHIMKRCGVAAGIRPGIRILPGKSAVQTEFEAYLEETALVVVAVVGFHIVAHPPPCHDLTQFMLIFEGAGEVKDYVHGLLPKEPTASDGGLFDPADG